MTNAPDILSVKMKQRCFCHDYYERGIYMITLEVEGRRPILGRLEGCAVAKTPLGESVEACWREIPRRHPEIQLLACIVMPDHFHGLLFVRTRMRRHLGEIVRGFKIGCTKAYRLGGRLSGESPSREPPSGDSPFGDSPYMANPPNLFAPGYHDRILTHRGQLKTLFRYIADNPRRLALIRQHPNYFTRINQLSLAGRVYAAYGSPFLLNRPDRLQIQCSRRITPDALTAETECLLDAAERGAVLVSPCISSGEKAIARAALEAGLPLIALCENGFAPKFKPPGNYFEACAEGRLLLLAPWAYHTDRRRITREQCLALNAMVAEICGPGAATLDYHGLVPAAI